jgi:hypothetical protein
MDLELLGSSRTGLALMKDIIISMTREAGAEWGQARSGEGAEPHRTLHLDIDKLIDGALPWG